MPRKNLAGTFEGAPAFRWKKMVDGTVFKLLCRARKNGEEKPNTGWLGLPEEMWTKDDSQAAANDWWEKRLNPHPLAALPAPIVAKLDKVKNAIAKLGVKDIREHLPIVDVLYAHSDAIEIQTTPKSYRLDFQVDTFLKQEAARGTAAQTFIELSDYLGFVRDYLGKDLDCRSIDGETVTKHWQWLAAKSWEGKGKNKRLGFFRRFVNWLWEQNVLPILPRNLKTKTQRFPVLKKKIRKFSDVASTINALPERYKLWALLCLNCGMTQVDLGALEWDQIDMKAETLTRWRIKLQRHADAPTVTYKLWPSTMKALREHKASPQAKPKTPKDGDLVFLSKAGTRMYNTETYMKDGKPKGKRKDLMGMAWQEMKPGIPLAKFRSIGASTLKESELTRPYDEVYLAETPTKMVDAHYGAEADDPFFRALEFIRERIFGK